MFDNSDIQALYVATEIILKLIRSNPDFKEWYQKLPREKQDGFCSSFFAALKSK